MLTLLISTAGLVFVGGAVSAAIAANTRQSRETAASNIYSQMVLRNGVTEHVPFSKSSDIINIPGLVEVYPHTRTHTSASVPAASPIAPVGAACPQENAPTEGRQPSKAPDDEPKVSVAKETLFKWNYPQGGFSADSPCEESLSVLRRLVADGERRKTVLCWAVFGSNGGSVYATAKPIIEEALSNAK